MKNLDLLSKRILVISLSISTVFLSASLLFFSVRPATAQTTPSFSSRMDDGRRYDAVSTNSYFLIWNTQTGTFKWINSANSTGSTTVQVMPSEEKFW